MAGRTLAHSEESRRDSTQRDHGTTEPQMQGHVNESCLFVSSRNLLADFGVRGNCAPTASGPMCVVRGQVLQVQTQGAVMRRPIATGPAGPGLFISCPDIVDSGHG